MTLETLKQGLSLFGFEMNVTDNYITFEHDEVEVTVYRGNTAAEVKLLLMNIPMWTELAEQAIMEQKGGVRHG